MQFARDAPALVVLHLQQTRGQFAQALFGLVAFRHLRFKLRGAFAHAHFEVVERGLHGRRPPEVDSWREPFRRCSELTAGSPL